MFTISLLLAFSCDWFLQILNAELDTMLVLVHTFCPHLKLQEGCTTFCAHSCVPFPMHGLPCQRPLNSAKQNVNAHNSSWFCIRPIPGLRGFDEPHLFEPQQC